MVKQASKKLHASGKEREKSADEPQADAIQDDSCRCKETAEMTPRQLLKRMMDDLAFWRRAK